MRTNCRLYKILTVLTAFSVLGLVNSTAQGENLSQSQQCAMSLCGAVENLPDLHNSDESNKAISAQTRADFTKNILPVVDQFMAGSLKAIKDAIPMMQAQLAQLNNESLNDREVVVNNLRWALGHPLIGSLVGLAEDSAGGGKTIDRSKAQTLLKDLDPSDRNFLIGYATAIINIPEYSDSLFLLENNFQQLMALKHPGMSFKTAAMADARRFKAIQEKLISLDPALNLTGQITMKYLTKLANGVEVRMNPAVIKRIRRIRFHLALHETVLFNDNVRLSFWLRRVKYDKIKFAKNISNTIEKINQFLKDQKRIQIARQKTIELVLKSYSASISAAPTENAIGAFQLQIPKLKKMALAVANDLHLEGEISRAIAKATFMLPTGKSKIAIQWVQSIQELNQYNLQDFSKFVSAAVTSKYNIEFPFDTADDQIYFSSLTDLAEDLSPLGITDKSFSSLGAISISAPSVSYPDYGIGILAHELGHMVSYASIFNSAVREIKSCTILNHMLNQTEAPKQFQEEDWADFFATRVLSKWQEKTASTKNFACLFLGKENSHFGSSKNPLSFINPDKSDPHSSDFFRLLRVQAEMNSLPDSCMNEVRSAGLIYFQTCGH